MVKFNIGINDIDQDNDGLIEISSLEQLDLIRNDLQGTALIDNNGVVTTDGWPNTWCNGYEPVTDLDFDINSDGSLDSTDTYFDYDNDGSNNGWLPIGNSTTPLLRPLKAMVIIFATCTSIDWAQTRRPVVITSVYSGR